MEAAIRRTAYLSPGPLERRWSLGVDPMAMYYYLPNKSALQDAIVEAVNEDIEGPAEFHSLSLYDLVMMVGRLFRATLLRHPNAAPLVAVRSVAPPLGMPRPGSGL